jgi:hypothetical protein
LSVSGRAGGSAGIYAKPRTEVRETARSRGERNQPRLVPYISQRTSVFP